jgi:uncharacterized membrane protein
MRTWAARFRTRQYLKGSLWVLPLLGAILGTLLAQLVLWIDENAHLPVGWHYSATTASTVLASITGAMVALLGFVVTIGVLVIQQATGTLSPRFMRLWYRDRLQKAVLATFTGTLTFAFSLLRKVEENSVPDLGVSLAGAAVVVSIIMLLIYLNRFTHALRPVAVAALVGETGHQVLTEWSGLVASSKVRGLDPTDAAPTGQMLAVTSTRPGAIQAVDAKGLIGAAVRHDCVLVLARSVGDFVPPGTTLIEVPAAAVGGVLDDDEVEELRGFIAQGDERTIEQDPAFALRIMVDIAIRALSAAINDPTTAVQVLDHIETFLQRLGRSDLRDRYVVTDAHGVVRLIIPGRGWDDYLRLGVTEIRAYGANSIQVCRRLRAMLDGLLDVLPADRHAPVRLELTRLDAAIDRSYADPDDRAAARIRDRQGLGAPTTENQEPPVPVADRGPVA